MHKLVFGLTVLLAATACPAQQLSPPSASTPPPRLLVAIAVDQLSSDLFEEYRPHFTGGLARLSRGMVFRNGYQAHAATETCPGHSTILTGTHPARNGIIGNSWYDQSLARADKEVYCAEDPRVPGSSSENYRVSPGLLKAPTLGELLKQRVPQSMNVAVAGKDRSAVMMGGRRVDQRWYWAGGRFATDQQLPTPPRSVAAANAAVAAMIAVPQKGLEPTPFCSARATPVPVGTRSVGTGRFARSAGEESLFRASPEFDGAVLALAAALAQEMRLGRDAAPDVLSVGLSATDYVGHRYGSGGQETCLQLLSLDRSLGDFFAVLDRSGIDYAVVLTSDHGVQDLPERARLRGEGDAARADPALAPGTIGKALAQKLGISGPVLLGDSLFGDIYLHRGLSAADRARVLREALAFYRAHPQVEAAFSADELRKVAIPTAPPDRWSPAERARASFDPQRSGDMIVLLKPLISPIADPSGSYVATHGSPWDYDRRVPILFWRRGMGSANRDEAIATVDIMPTLAAMIGLAPPSTVDGRCLTGIQGVACPVR